MTVREVARQAEVDKNTYLRLERGQAVRLTTLERVCTALGTTPGRQMLELAKPSEWFTVSRAASRKWEAAPEKMRLDEPEDFDSEKNRLQFGWDGRHAGFNGFLDCELFGGALVSSMIELFEMSTLRSFVGEELIYCLRGPVRMLLGEESLELVEGDAVCLWADQLHRAGPTVPIVAGQRPPAILSVRLVGRRSSSTSAR